MLYLLLNHVFSLGLSNTVFINCLYRYSYYILFF
nr:MAG TPA: hypothetical protein [Caudoviricetes sp.]